MKIEAQDPRRERAHHRAGWLVAPLLLGASLAAVRLVISGPDALFAWAAGAALASALAWVLVSVLFPASADRTCPACGQSALERLDRGSTRGLGCARCGWRDEAASSFLLAEEEGPLEHAVLAERRRKHARESTPEEAAAR
jgi:hypothetical protein